MAVISARSAAGAVLVSVLLLVVFIPGLRGVDGVIYPYDVDQFRDISLAQGVLDGKGLADPMYAGETIWYNPLLSWIVAGISAVSGSDVPYTYVKAGPILNLLTPLAFFIMVAWLAGVESSVLATTYLLFSPAYEMPWATPSYSIWIFPIGFGFALFGAGAVLLLLAIRDGRVSRWVVAGAGLGITFLAHSTPALILGLCALLLGLWPGPGDLGLRQRMGRVMALCATAFAVSSPLLWSILFNYRLRTVNDEPGNYVWPTIDVDHAPDVFVRLVSPWTAVAVLGLAAVVRRAPRDIGARLILCWLGIGLSLFIAEWFRQVSADLPIPRTFPQYHFYYYVAAAGFVLVGIGGWFVLQNVGRLLGRIARGGSAAISGALLVAAVALFVGAHYERFTTRRDFDILRREALMNSGEIARSNVLARLRTQTPPDAVVLASERESLRVVGPAGRYVVSLPSEFSNPFVAFAPRRSVQREMFTALAQEDLTAFAPIAKAQGVTHVLLGPADTDQMKALEHASDARLLSSAGGYLLYALSGR